MVVIELYILDKVMSLNLIIKMLYIYYKPKSQMANRVIYLFYMTVLILMITKKNTKCFPK